MKVKEESGQMTEGDKSRWLLNGKNWELENPAVLSFLLTLIKVE